MHIVLNPSEAIIKPRQNAQTATKELSWFMSVPPPKPHVIMDAAKSSICDCYIVSTQTGGMSAKPTQRGIQDTVYQ